MVLTEPASMGAPVFIESPLQLHKLVLLRLDKSIQHFDLLVCLSLVLGELRLHFHRLSGRLEKLVISLRETSLHKFYLLHHRLVIELYLRKLVDLATTVGKHLRESLAIVQNIALGLQTSICAPECTYVGLL